MYPAGGVDLFTLNMLMLDYLKYKCYRMKYRLHMGNAHMACDRREVYHEGGLLERCIEEGRRP